MNSRPSWDQYFLSITETVAKRGTCPRRKVGCVIVDPTNRVLSTGYNGALPGQPHCDENGCDLVHDHCVRVVHAEQNAIFQGLHLGAAIRGATAYVTLMPCWGCFKALVSVGIARIVYENEYKPDERIRKALEHDPSLVVLVKASASTIPPRLE